MIDSSTNTVVDTIPVGVNPTDIEFNPSNNRLYVSNSDTHDVSVIDSSTNTVVETIDVDGYPTTMLFNPFNNDIYIDSGLSQNISVIDSSTNTVVENIEVGDGWDAERAMLFNPKNNYVYVTNFSSDDVSIIDSTTNKLASTVKVGTGPIGLAFNPSNNHVYVTNINSDDVSIIKKVFVPSEEQPTRIGDLIKGIIQNPLDVTNSIESANEITDILTDNNLVNDQLVCNIIDSEAESTSNIREILDC